jgi:hypothetical protein
VAAWWQSDPDSEVLNELVAELRNQLSFGEFLAEESLASVARLFGGRPLMQLEGRRSLVRAQQISELYEMHYHQVVSFDRGVLRAVWGNCSAKGCEEAQRAVEEKLGKIGKPRPGDRPLRRPRTERRAPQEETAADDPTR